jgi:hypothetical protein
VSKRLNYANVTATLALFFAMTGGALAAKHYLINSTKQINPKVLRALKGNEGPKGATGTPGAPGKEGPQGKEGPPGKTGAGGEAGTALAFGDFTPVGEIQENTIPKNVSAANIDHTATGVYCFKNLSFAPKSAMVSADNSFGVNNTIVSVVVAPKNEFLGGCTPGVGEIVRVRTFDPEAKALADRAFSIWFN